MNILAIDVGGTHVESAGHRPPEASRDSIKSEDDSQ